MVYANNDNNNIIIGNLIQYVWMVLHNSFRNYNKRKSAKINFGVWVVLLSATVEVTFNYLVIIMIQWKPLNVILLGPR
jgi:hypothetical protein